MKNPKYMMDFSDILTRYTFALPYCANKSTLDAGSKRGHGAHILSYAAKDLTLSDVDRIYLKKSQNLCYFCPVKTEVCNFENSFPTGQWEAITCFEVIEHLENVDFFVKNLADHLAPGGLLVFSVPHMIANHLHKTLFDEEKIKTLISKYLTIKEFYIQDKQPISGRPLRGGYKCYLGVAVKQ